MANFSKSFNFRNGVQVDDDKFIVKPTTGLVGIGSTAPTEVLDVVGNIQATGITSARDIFAGAGITVGYANSNRIMLDIDPLTGVSSITAQRFYGDGSNMSGIFAISVAGFVANDTNGGILTSFRKVGIGVTTPTDRFDVEGDSKFTGITTFVGVSTVSGDLFSTNLGVSGNSDLKGNLNVGSANVTGVSTFTGISTNTSLIQANGLSVAGVSTFIGDVLFRGDGIVKFGQPFGNVPRGGAAIFYGSHSTGRNMTWDSGNLVFDDMAKARFGNTIVGGLVPDMEIYWNGSKGVIEHWGGLNIRSYSKGDVFIDSGLSVVGVTTLRNLDVTGISTLNSDVRLSSGLNVSGISTFNGAIDANAGATLNQLNVTGVSTLTGRLTATEINSASSNVVRLLQGGTQVFNTIGAGVSVSNTLKIGSLNGGTSGLSALDATLIYGDESGANAFMTRESFNILNNDTGNFNYFLNINNLKDSGTDRTGDFVWHKASNALMTLTGIGGSLGIGVTTPSVALEVVGGATLGGTVNMPGNVAVGGSLTVDNFILGNLTGDITGNVTGNLTGNVTATDGESTIDTLLAPTQIGIGSTGTHPQLGPEPFFVNPGAGPDENAYKMVHINNEGRIGIGTNVITGGAGSVQRVDVHGETQIRDGSLLVGQKQIPSSAVDFSDVVNIPDQQSYAWAADRSRIAYMLPPKVTTAQRDQLYDGAANSGNGGGTVVAGALIYNTSTNRIELYNGSGWVGLGTVA